MALGRGYGRPRSAVICSATAQPKGALASSRRLDPRPAKPFEERGNLDPSKLFAPARSGTAKPSLVWPTVFTFCLLTVAQLILPLPSFPSRFFPHCARFTFVHYPFEDVSSGTVDSSDIEAVQVAGARWSGPPRLSQREPRQYLTALLLPQTAAPFHRRIPPPSSLGDDPH
jgi:hypothetical protein